MMQEFPLFTRVLSVKDRTENKTEKSLLRFAGQHTGHIKKSQRPNETALEGDFFWAMISPCSRRGAILHARFSHGVCQFATMVNQLARFNG